MGRRRKARECALQILFQLEFDRSPIEAVLSKFWEDKKASSESKDYCSQLIRGVCAQRKEIDAEIQSVSENWRISRMALVDRNILRLAAFELLYQKHLAPAIVINEGVEISKKYSSDQASNFINGILDALRKKHARANGMLEDKNHD